MTNEGRIGVGKGQMGGRREEGNFRMRVRVVGSDEGESEEEVMIWANLNPNFNVLNTKSLTSDNYHSSQL